MLRASFGLAVLAAALGLLTPADSSAQIDPIHIETLDGRTPLELTSGRNAVDGTIILGALFEGATRISAFVGPDHGMGPWIEEIVEPPGPTGETFFALSRRTVCVDGACHFSAVNGATNDIELFTRDPMGIWSRSIIATGGGYFNSDLGLNDGRLTALGYEAFLRTLRIFDAPLPAGGPPPIFSLRASRPGAADAIFGAMRATLAAEDENADFLVLFETDDGLPAPVRPDGRWHPSSPDRDHAMPAHRRAPHTIGKGGGSGTVNAWGELDGSAFEATLGILLSPPSGGPGTLRESSSLLDCGVYLCVRHNQDGEVELAVIGPMGEVFQDFQVIGVAELLEDGTAPSGFDIEKVDDRFASLPGFWVSWPTGAAFVGVSLDTGTVSTIELDRDSVMAPETGPVAAEPTMGSNVLEGFAGSLVVQVVDPLAGQSASDIPTLSAVGTVTLALALALLGFAMLTRRRSIS